MVSFQEMDYPCAVHSTITISECKMTAGTTIIPAKIKMQVDGDVAVDTKVKITIPRVKNGPYDGPLHMPMVTVRTKNPEGVALEESDHYIGSTTEPTGAATAAASLIDAPNTAQIVGGYVQN